VIMVKLEGWLREEGSRGRAMGMVVGPSAGTCGHCVCMYVLIFIDLMASARRASDCTKERKGGRE
jgi:hypothetical protein